MACKISLLFTVFCACAALSAADDVTTATDVAEAAEEYSSDACANGLCPSYTTTAAAFFDAGCSGSLDTFATTKLAAHSAAQKQGVPASTMFTLATASGIMAFVV